MSQKSANSKALNAFKFDENIFRDLCSNTTKVKPSFSSTGVLKFCGKSAESATLTPKEDKIETSTQMTPGFANYCIGKTISFIDDGDDESLIRNVSSKSQILQSPSFEKTFTSPMHNSNPIFMASERQHTPNDQLCKSFSKNEASAFQNRGGEDDTEYLQASSSVSKVSFKRKYKPLLIPFRHNDSVVLLSRKNNITEDIDAEEKISENDFDKIVPNEIGSVESNKPSITDEYALQHAGDVGNYRYYALFLMVMSNLIGFGLTLTFQVLLFLKSNADNFLNKSWIHWKNSGLFQRENNLLMLSLLIPALVVVGLAYSIIWSCFGVNKFLLTEVPDRVVRLFCFNRIVKK